ncbi:MULTISPECIES: EthD domain-containing protein [Pseudofrankia]|uniref:EthD domain-containing protein n=1 Tax=Pseudofrankia TaxID=2994363 RepID=UPI000234DA88|nr:MULTISPECIES: EthD domain-containing protein [Pseudofrankia]OHV39012.1 hypothetical protein BCD49_11875 [Pseudofrankia sp. EUN1h]
MIKLFRFARRDPALTARVFETAWWREATRAAEAPPEVRPVRVVVGTVLPGLSTPAGGGPGEPGEDAPRPRYDVMSVLWFPDIAALGRFESSRATPDVTGDGGRGAAGAAPEPATLVTLVAEERVARGADWFERHLAAGGGAFKHLALARRTAGLTRAEFSERWAAHGAQVRVVGTATTTAIPESVRGDAYVQNHPLAAADDPAYDAVNEVYFDELAGLRARARWFQENPLDGSGTDLFGPTTFLAVREDVLLAGVPAGAS